MFSVLIYFGTTCTITILNHHVYTDGYITHNVSHELNARYSLFSRSNILLLFDNISSSVRWRWWWCWITITNSIISINESRIAWIWPVTTAALYYKNNNNNIVFIKLTYIVMQLSDEDYYMLLAWLMMIHVISLPSSGQKCGGRVNEKNQF